ncbi:hypothetical protein ACIBSW_24710 [Actinoplanes sp. NPDC049668]|uniref:tetratricopeptide repeat protein n=1 Tax=unclassified Actinoplanes TaxID=2626549 RepID=UPI0033B78280
MDADESRSVRRRPPAGGPRREPVRRPRKLAHPDLDAGPQREVRDMLYGLHEKAGRLALEVLEKRIAADDRLEGSPKKDLIRRIICEGGPAKLVDVRAVAQTLARACGQDEYAAAARVAQLMDSSGQPSTAPVHRPAQPVHRLGRPVDACDPLVLEVHPAIQVPGSGKAEGLPGYVPRAHDVRLRELVAAMIADGRSRLVMLVGGSSTGKTRAGWELARYLEEQQPGRWRLWHPYDPTRPRAALADLKKVGPDTIVWLNEAQHYLMPPDPALGERITAGLRTLLQDREREPVLVLATLWPNYWTTLTARPTDSPDVHGQARELLALGTAVTLTDTFTPTEIADLAGPGIDARLRYAAEHAEHGRITQYLAGAPALEDRYRTAPPAARALLQVAIDARRLGHPLDLPHALLEQAAPGYLDDHDWNALDDDWLESALAYTAQPCKGARGLLTRIRPRGSEPPRPDGEPCYRLADYLEQLGGIERAAVYPPDSLWRAFTATVTDPDLLRNLCREAGQRGRYQHAVWLNRQAADLGDIDALRALAELMEQAGDRAGAEALYPRQAADQGDTTWLLDDPETEEVLAVRREQAGDQDGAEAVAVQAADRGDTGVLWVLAELREQAGDQDGAEAVAVQAADRGDAGVLRALAELREQAGDQASADALYRQAADRGDTGVLRALAVRRDEAGDQHGAEALYQRAADRGDTDALRVLAVRRDEAGDQHGAEALAVQAADRGDTRVLRALAELREQASDQHGAEALYQQAADRGDTELLLDLAGWREQAGDQAGAEALAVQAADRGDTGVLLALAELREQAGDQHRAEALYQQAADRGDTDALRALAVRRDEAGDQDGAEALAVQAADRGDTGVLLALFWGREWAGDQARADAAAVQAADRGEADLLLDLAGWREQAGDQAGAEALAVQAADRGDTRVLRALAGLREQAGDQDGAEALYQQAADRGDIGVLRALAELREQASDQHGAEALAVQAADHGDTRVLRALAELREQAGDQASAEALYQQAADRGDTTALRALAIRREQTGDRAGAEALAVQAANRGDTRVWLKLVVRREQAGDRADANRIQRFGLTGSGEIATALDFDS